LVAETGASGLITPLSRTLIIVVVGIGTGAATGRALALGECARFGNASYTADRTVQISGQTIRSRVYVTPQAEREELTINGRPEIRLSIGMTQTIYNLENNTGISRTLPAPTRPPKDTFRTREEDAGGTKLLVVEAVDGKGLWHEVGRTTCRADGAVLATTFTITLPGSSEIVTGHMTQNITASGPLDPNLFKVPPQVKIERPPPP
jgi:hypothetical protein